VRHPPLSRCVCCVPMILALFFLQAVLCPRETRGQQVSPAAHADGTVLPFPRTPSASVAGQTLHVISSPYRSWRFDATTTRMPEFAAPALGKRSNHVAVEVEVGEEASGVLYAMGGASGGVTVYMDKGQLVYEYNMLIIERTKAKSAAKITAGRYRIEVDETIARPGAQATVVLRVDGQDVARATVKRTVPGAFTASETLDVGVDLGSPVSLVGCQPQIDELEYRLQAARTG
jgi:hypothetical protein